MANRLLLYTGQRGSDVARIARPAVGEKIRVVQQKTGAPLTITVHPELRRSFEACPSGHLAAIVTAHGVPFSIKGFGQFMSDEFAKPDCRRTARLMVFGRPPRGVSRKLDVARTKSWQ